MDVYLRPANPETDYVRIAELINTVDPEPVTAEMLRERDAELAARSHRTAPGRR